MTGIGSIVLRMGLVLARIIGRLISAQDEDSIYVKLINLSFLGHLHLNKQQIC